MVERMPDETDRIVGDNFLDQLHRLVDHDRP